MDNKEQASKLELENAELKKQIEQLKNEVEHHRIRTALIDKADLPKAKSPACYNCKYAAFVQYKNGGIWFLGCGRELAKGGCDGYEHTNANKGSLEEMRDYLLTMGKDYYPSQVLSQTCDFLHFPEPPCHEQ